MRYGFFVHIVILCAFSFDKISIVTIFEGKI